LKFFLVIPVLIYGQSWNKNDIFWYDWLFNMNVGITNFFGDLDHRWNTNVFDEHKFATGCWLIKPVSPVFCVGTQILRGRLTGAKLVDKDNNRVDLYFTNRFIEYNINCSVNLNMLFDPYGYYNRVYTELLLGAGFVDFRTKLRQISSGRLVRSFGYHGKATTEWIIPFGLRVTFMMNDLWFFTLETTTRRVNTDKLDAQPGNNNSDYYNYTSIGIGFRIYEYYLDNYQKNILKVRAKRSQELNRLLIERRNQLKKRIKRLR